MQKSNAFWILGAFIVVIAAVSVYVVYLRPISVVAPPPPPPEAHIGSAVIAQPPAVAFHDVTNESGVKFVHVHGGYGRKLLPETMGSGVLVFDFNQDGHQDLLFVNSRHWPHYQYDSPRPEARLAVYENDGQGRFRDVAEKMGLGKLVCYGMGAAAGDVDNDGFPEVIITALDRCYLLYNEQGKAFRDITEAAGLSARGWSSSAAFLDYDRDGRLDLFVGHYVKWTHDTDLYCKLIGEEKSYCQPFLYEGEHCQLFHNLTPPSPPLPKGGTVLPSPPLSSSPPLEKGGPAGVRFEDVSAKAGIQVKGILDRTASKCLGVAVHDYDDDGWPDIAVANDTTYNFLFHNNRDGTFSNVANPKGAELLNERGGARGAMGIHFAYYRDGGTLGLAVANFSNEPTGLLRYDKAHDLFIDCAVAEGVSGPSRLPLKFGLFFFDYDLDGRPDLFTSNGHIEPEIERIQAAVKYAQPAQLFWNAGPTAKGCYREVTAKEAGADLFKPRVGRGCAFGDLDGDGDLDIALNNNNQPATVLRNDCAPTAKAIRLRFRGVESNRDGIGCRVKVRAGGQMQQAELASGGSYMSQSELVLTFGLGKHDAAEEVEVRWPNAKGTVTKLGKLPAGFIYLVDEQKGIVGKAVFRR